MKEHEGCIRGFYSLSRAYYAHIDKEPEVLIGFYHPDGGTTGEFSVKWIHIGKETVPRLQVFNDAWETLTHFKDFLEMLGTIDGIMISEIEFCHKLEKLGMKDLTDYKMRR